MKVKNKALGLDFDLPPITQAELERYYDYVSADEDGGQDANTVRGWAAAVRSAGKVGWLDGLDVGDLDNWPPAKTRLIWDRLLTHIGQSVQVPTEALMVQVYRHITNPKEHPAPEALTLEFRARKYGALPNAGGIKDQQVGMLEQMIVAGNVWDAVQGYRRTQDKAKWIKTHPQGWRIYQMVQKAARDGA